MNPDPAVIDHARLDELADEDPEFLQELVEIFLEDAEAHVSALAQADAGDDVAEIARIAHMLKGASANIGANGLAEAARRLEAAGRDGDRDRGAIISEVKEAFSASATALRALPARPG